MTAKPNLERCEEARRGVFELVTLQQRISAHLIQSGESVGGIAPVMEWCPRGGFWRHGPPWPEHQQNEPKRWAVTAHPVT